MTAPNNQTTHHLFAPATNSTNTLAQGDTLPSLACSSAALGDVSLFAGMPALQRISAWDAGSDEYVDDARLEIGTGVVEGMQYTPDYYVCEAVPEYSWDEGLRAIDEFDWAIDKEEVESGAADSCGNESGGGEESGQRDGCVEADTTGTAGGAGEARGDESLGRSERVTSTCGEKEGARTGQADTRGAGHEMIHDVAMGGVQDDVMPEVKKAPITPKSIRAMSAPVRLSMSPDAPSPRVSAPGDLDVQDSTTERGKEMEEGSQGPQTLEAWESDTVMLSPEAEGIEVVIPADREQPCGAKHESKDGQDSKLWAEQLHEVATIHAPKSPCVNLPKLLPLDYSHEAEHSDETGSTKLANNTSGHVKGHSSTPVATAASHGDASPPTNLPARNLTGKENDVPSDDSEGIHLVGQPSRAPSPAPTTPPSATRGLALDDGAGERDERSWRSRILVPTAHEPGIHDTTPAQRQHAPDDAAAAPTGRDARKRDRHVEAGDSLDSEDDARGEERARLKESEFDDEEFYDARDELECGQSSRMLGASAGDMHDEEIETREVESGLHGAPSDDGQEYILPSAHDVPAEYDYDMQEHFSDVPTRSSSHLSDAHTPPAPHRSPGNIVSNRELAALGSTLAPGMYLGSAEQADQRAGKRKRKSASSIAGERVYFGGDEFNDDDGDEKEEEVEVEGVKKRRRDGVSRVDTRYQHGGMREAKQEEQNVGEDECEEHELKGKKSRRAAATRSKITPRLAADGGKRCTRGGTGSRAGSMARTSDAEDVNPGAEKTRLSPRLSTPSVATPTTVRNKFGFTPPKTRSRASLASTPDPGSATAKSKTVGKAKGTRKVSGAEVGSGKTVGKERMTRGAAAKEAKEAKEKNIGKRLRSGDV